MYDIKYNAKRSVQKFRFKIIAFAWTEEINGSLSFFFTQIVEKHTTSHNSTL